MKNSTTFIIIASIAAACVLSRAEPASAGTLAVSNHAKFSGTSGLVAAPGSACLSPETVELDSAIVIADVTACNFIRATNTTVSGNVDFLAGLSVALADGFTVATGADFSIAINKTLTTLAFVTDRSPAGEPTYKAAFRLRMDELEFPPGNPFVIHLAGFSSDGTRHFEVRLRHNSSPNEDRLVLAAREDDGSVVVVPFGEEVMLPVGPHNLIAVNWRAGGGTGRFVVSLNGVPFGGLTGLDNFLARIDRVEWGITDGEVKAFTGHLDMDDFLSTD